MLPVAVGSCIGVVYSCAVAGSGLVLPVAVGSCIGVVYSCAVAGSGLVLPVAVGSCIGILLTVFLLLLTIQCRRARDKPQPPTDPGRGQAVHPVQTFCKILLFYFKTYLKCLNILIFCFKIDC